jgi:hypothetical protein
MVDVICNFFFVIFHQAYIIKKIRMCKVLQHALVVVSVVLKPKYGLWFLLIFILGVVVLSEDN